jgi:alpha-beta hydrolase superfamily lysophospholipase
MPASYFPGSTALDLMAAGLNEAGGVSGDLSAFNAGFDHRTGYEWLSRDEAEVDKYVADPLSGFAMDAETTCPSTWDGCHTLTAGCGSSALRRSGSAASRPPAAKPWTRARLPPPRSARSHARP